MFGKKLAEEVKDYVRENYARKHEVEFLERELCCLRGQFEALKEHLGVDIAHSSSRYVVKKKEK